MPRTKKPIPLEIGLYIGERLVEFSIFSANKPSTLRLRFAKSQRLTVGQRCFYYLWTPYSRLPSYLELEVTEIEEEREGEYTTGAYFYRIIESTELKKWPPRV